MEHTSTICKINNMIDKPKHLKSAFIHEIEEPATMKMSIWNAQQMAKKIDNRSYYKMLQKKTTISLPRLNIPRIPIPERSGPYEVSTPKLEDATPC